MMSRPRVLLTTACGAVLGVTAAVLPAVPVSATQDVVPKTALQWSDCNPEGKDDPAEVAGSQCATLQVPVDWRDPNGPTFGLAVARRTAKEPTERVGVLMW